MERSAIHRLREKGARGPFDRVRKRISRIAAFVSVSKTPLKKRYLLKMIDSREMTRHTPQPQDTMNTNLITSIATRRNPAVAGIPFCPAMAIGQSLPRPEEMIIGHP